MAIIRDYSKAQIAFRLHGGNSDDFLVTRYRGSEGICQLYRFEIELASQQEGWALANIVGKSAALSIATSEGERYFHGVVSRFELTGETVDMTYYRAELVPSLWLLTHRYCSRIFQNKDVKTIINEVLTGGGIAADHFDMSKLAKTYPEREYCVQYRETDFNFICRLMEEEGIWWYFDQTKDKPVLKMCEKANDYLAITGEAKLAYRSAAGMNVDVEHIWRFRLGQTVRPGAVSLTDFDFKNPQLGLDVNASSGRDAGLAFADYPGIYSAQARGTSLAKLRAEEFECSRISGNGLSNSRRIAPGRTFELTDHPSVAMNQKYLVTTALHQGKQAITRTTSGGGERGGVLNVRIHEALVAARTHEMPAVRELAEGLLMMAGKINAGDPTADRGLSAWLYHGGQVVRESATVAMAQGANPLEFLSPPNLLSDIAMSAIVDFESSLYQCRFECIPATVEFRPPRITPWPIVRGAQTARVVGPESEEIHCDEYGRVKVQFHWDTMGFEGGDAKRFGADSSCWIRVSQGAAGGQYGMMFIPRVGQEVIVDFLEGNPDYPVIVGRVFNKDHMPPYALPDHKTRSVIKTHTSKGGGGCNEIRFEDLKDKEQLFIQAQRQMDLRVKASHFHTVGGAYHLRVGDELREFVNKSKHVHIKEHLYTWVEGEEHRAIQGLQAIEVQGTRSIHVKDSAMDLYGADHKMEVTGTFEVAADKILLDAPGGIEIKSGGSSITLSSSGVHIVGSMVYINSGSGPAVAPASASGMSPAAAEDPTAADKSDPGKDTRYTAPGVTPPVQPSLPDVPGEPFEPEQPTPAETSWIEIELVDEAERPVAGERYEIITPDGKKREGVTDANGRARISSIQPGNCQIKFPRLDSDAWIRHP